MIRTDEASNFRRDAIVEWRKLALRPATWTTSSVDLTEDQDLAIERAAGRLNLTDEQFTRAASLKVAKELFDAAKPVIDTAKVWAQVTTVLIHSHAAGRSGLGHPEENSFVRGAMAELRELLGEPSK